MTAPKAIAQVVYSDSEGNSQSYLWKPTQGSLTIEPTEMAAKVFTDLLNFIDSNAGYNISVTVSSSGGATNKGTVSRLVSDKIEELLNGVEVSVGSLRDYTYELNIID